MPNRGRPAAAQSRSVINRPMTMGAKAKVCETERSNSPLIMSRVTPRATMPSDAERAARALNWGKVRNLPPERTSNRIPRARKPTRGPDSGRRNPCSKSLLAPCNPQFPNPA